MKICWQCWLRICCMLTIIIKDNKNVNSTLYLYWMRQTFTWSVICYFCSKLIAQSLLSNVLCIFISLSNKFNNSFCDQVSMTRLLHSKLKIMWCIVSWWNFCPFFTDQLVRIFVFWNWYVFIYGLLLHELHGFCNC